MRERCGREMPRAGEQCARVKSHYGKCLTPAAYEQDQAGKRAYNRAYYWENRDHELERVARWAAANPLSRALSEIKSGARRRGNR